MNERIKRKPIVKTVTVNWNGKDVLIRCLSSLLQQTLAVEEVIVVDNASQDGSAEAVRQHFKNVVVLENPENYGAPKGRNVGLRYALETPVDYILTLDNDLYAADDCIEKMVSVLEENPQIATVAAFIYDDENKDQLLSAGAIVDYTQNISRQLKTFESLESLNPISYCGTGHMLTRASLYREIGLLEEAYIGYGFEDTDFGMRTRQTGYDIVSYGQAKVWHHAHAGIGRYSFKKKYLESRNAILFMRKYAGWQNWLKYFFYLVFGIVYASIREGLRGNIRGVWGKVLGTMHGFTEKKSLAYKLLGINTGLNR